MCSVDLVWVMSLTAEVWTCLRNRAVTRAWPRTWVDFWESDRRSQEMCRWKKSVNFIVDVGSERESGWNLSAYPHPGVVTVK